MGAIENRLTQETINVLRKNILFKSSIEELREGVDINRIVGKFESNNYQLHDSVKQFLSYFANKTISFIRNGEEEKVKFRVNTSLKSNIASWDDTYGLTGLVPFGSVFDDYMTIFSDSNGKTYAAFDGILVFYGNDPFEALNNLVINAPISKVEFDITDDNDQLKLSYSQSEIQNTKLNYIDEFDEFEINADDVDEFDFVVDIGGQIDVHISESGEIESISYGRAREHHVFVQKMPYIPCEFGFFQIKSITKKDLSIPYTEQTKFLKDREGNFLFQLRDVEKVRVFMISDQIGYLIDGNDNFVGLKLSYFK